MSICIFLAITRFTFYTKISKLDFLFRVTTKGILGSKAKYHLSTKLYLSFYSPAPGGVVETLPKFTKFWGLKMYEKSLGCWLIGGRQVGGETIFM